LSTGRGPKNFVRFSTSIIELPNPRRCLQTV
jgi:hypothetical protein